jgi:hypothetical protein
MLADWLLDRVKGKPVKSERVWIDSAGRAHSEPFAKPKRSSGAAKKIRRR